MEEQENTAQDQQEDVSNVAEAASEQKQREPNKKEQAYISGLMKLLHSKQTSKVVDQMLQADRPEKSIPDTALFVEDQMEKMITQKAPLPSLDTRFLAGQYLVSDLITIGNTAGWWEITQPEQIQPILQDTFQKYIEKGLHDGTIDPIELQQKAEGLMTDEQKAKGLEMAGVAGVPHQPDQFTAMAAYGHQRERQGMTRGQQQQGVLNNGS